MFDVRAYNGAGRELQIVRADPSQWNIAGHDGSVRLTYKVFGKIVDGTYLAIDTSHAHMNMPATLMWARRLDSRPVRVTFVPPAGVKVETGDAIVPDRGSVDVHGAQPAVSDGQSNRAQRLLASDVQSAEP